ncbi:hypothetical protein [Dictyobacter alpinus]|uniref:hypothetical protein n=1 Tax=Dictyobacter alpinus TaxID=2014873 RepID=UPI000F82F39A|nr:hypothetical protein [Dictyobacter alpinus]
MVQGTVLARENEGQQQTPVTTPSHPQKPAATRTTSETLLEHHHASNSVQGTRTPPATGSDYTIIPTWAGIQRRGGDQFTPETLHVRQHSQPSTSTPGAY